MTVQSTIAALHRRNFGDRNSLDDELAELLESYDLDDDVPSWFVEMFAAVNNCVNQSGYFDRVGSDIASVLVELSEDFGWSVDDAGEEIRIAFPVSQVDVLISREAVSPDGSSCCSYCGRCNARDT